MPKEEKQMIAGTSV